MTGPSAAARAFQPDDGATYKLIYLARRRVDMPADEFPQAWREHSRLASNFAASLGAHFRGSRQCVKDAVADADPVFANDYDGSTILTMKSWPDLLAARYHPHALDELLEDEKRVFAGTVDDWTMAAEETVLRDGDTQDHVLLSFLAPDAALSTADFATRAGDCADRLAEASPDASRIVWNRVVDPARAYPFAAVAELWFAERAAMVAATRAPAVIAALTQPGIADPERSVHLAARLNLAKSTSGAGGATNWSEAG